MTKKSPKKKLAAESKGGISISGGVHARRDVIMGNQYIDLRQQIAQVVSPEEFLARARDLQARLVEIKGQPDLLPAQVETIDVVEGQIQQVIEEAGKPQPLATRISATLTGAKAVMDSLSEGVKSAAGLGAALAGLAEIAFKVFGGG
jgi:hypothetical protein